MTFKPINDHWKSNGQSTRITFNFDSIRNHARDRPARLHLRRATILPLYTSLSLVSSSSGHQIGLDSTKRFIASGDIETLPRKSFDVS